MKRLLFFLLLGSFAFQGNAQDLKEVMLTNQIKEVTLFLSGAQVFESATGSLPAGESVLLVKGLSPFLDEKSIQVKGQGNFTIQAVNKRLDFLHEKEEGEKAKALEKEIAEIEKRQSNLRNRIQVLGTKMSVLSANKSIGSSQAGTSMTALKTTLDFFDAEHTKIVNEELQINTQLAVNDQEIEALRNQLYALQQSDDKAKAEIRIRANPSPSHFNCSTRQRYSKIQEQIGKMSNSAFRMPTPTKEGRLQLSTNGNSTMPDTLQ